MHTKQTAKKTKKWEPLSRDQRGGQRFREHRGNEGLLVCGMHIKFYFFTNVLKKLVDKTLNFNNIYKTQIMIVILMENQVRGWLWLVQHWLGKERNY